MVANTNVAFALNRAVELLIIIINQELMRTSVHQQATLLMTVFYLVNKAINRVNSLLTSARKDNVEHMTTVGSGTQPQLLQDCISPW